MPRRDIYLKIEPIPAYSPLAPILCARRYGRDCMRNPGHEIGRVTAEEIFATTIDALVYREYLDPQYTRPDTAKLVGSDVNEPPWDRRVPGCVLYAEPGEELHLHVLNGDDGACHSLHLHVGPALPGADLVAPAPVRGLDAEIRPGESWTYVFEATGETVGAWAFHDHVRAVGRWVSQGLFGGLIVRDPRGPKPDHEIPMFVHQLAGDRGQEGFESPTLTQGMSWSHVFGPAEATYNYHCRIHGPTMAGQVRVAMGAPDTATVTMVDNTFTPGTITVAPGGAVTWFNSSSHAHIVFSGGGGVPAYCLNGRTYVGNTPTVVAEPGERLRWYVFNLDLGGTWHNFHPHSARWQLPTPFGGASDIHSLSPVETFVVDTEAPPVLRLSPDLEKFQNRHPKDACRIGVRGDFLFHCHIEEHMMQGLAGLVRSRQQLWVPEEGPSAFGIDPPYDDNECPPVDGTRTCGAATVAGPEGPIPMHGPEVMPRPEPMARVPGMVGDGG